MKTNFDKISSFNKEELANWFYKNFDFAENTPWIKWLDRNFCKKCKPIIGHYSDYLDREVEFAPCECGDCPFGIELDNDYSLIARWLDSAETDDCD